MAQYVYTMNRVGKIVPPKRVILKDISLSLLPRRQDRRAGPERLRQVEPAADHGRRGQGVRRRGRADARTCASASCRRSRSSIPSKTVREAVEEGLGEMLAAQGEARRDLRGVRRARRRFRRARRRAGAAGSDHRRRRRRHRACRWRSPPMRCACRRGTRRSATSRAARSGASRCAGCCCRSPTCCCSTSRPTTSMPRASIGSSSSCSNFPGTVIAVTHDRYFLDNAAEWILELDRGYGIPWKGNYSSWLEQKEAAPRSRSRSRKPRASRRCRRSSSGCARTRRAARRRARRASRASRSCPHYEHQKRNETQEIFIPVAERLGDEVIEFKNVSQGVTATAC